MLGPFIDSARFRDSDSFWSGEYDYALNHYLCWVVDKRSPIKLDTTFVSNEWVNW